MASKSVDKKIDETDVVLAMVIYSDGGCKPNPGKQGWGVHGYIYEDVPAKKGTGNQSHILTADGYKPKSFKGKQGIVEIKPISYIDGFGSSLDTGTNNSAEIKATAAALEKAATYAISKLNIYTDSEYTKKGMNEWLPFWLARDWIKTDGTPVANAADWKILSKNLDILKSRGVVVTADWVRSHTEGEDREIGNVCADKLASIGVKYSASGEQRCQFKETAADGYWSKTPEKHPFINSRRMYFNTNKETFVSGQYYLGNHGADDDLLGVKNADGAFCYLELATPDKALETVRILQADLAGQFENIAMARLDKLYSQEVYEDLIDFGAHSLHKKSNKNDLYCIDGDPLTKEFVPPKLAARAENSLSFLNGLLQRYKNNDPSLQVVDLTDKLYTSEEVSKKSVTTISHKFKPEYNVGFCALPIEFDAVVNGSIVKTKTTLTLGVDSLNRNALKNLEDMSPKISLVVWREGDEVLRFATVAESLGSYGIWCGVYSNLIFIPKV